ncbi:hypothetical protein [Mycolicibacterium sp. 050158]|jgi:hypothetical protein|uniref:hypothetical protein n=1 Tax=Mycolicibacterium sp. 050158 TaxID=3090602 RepID=UPI00299F1855|nr:hypothetical protein [Mycolicibacterium sp. 050158]MDX1888414.1 hypothetical protein [Mycolicibacterium sp. 050158]
MNIITRTLAATAIAGAAALGLAGAASAATNTSPQGPGNSFSPGTYATPAPTVGPGWYGNHGPAYIAHLTGR